MSLQDLLIEGGKQLSRLSRGAAVPCDKRDRQQHLLNIGAREAMHTGLHLICTREDNNRLFAFLFNSYYL